MGSRRRIELCARCGADPWATRESDGLWYIGCTDECGMESVWDESRFTVISKWNEMQLSQSEAEGEIAGSGDGQVIPEPSQDCKAIVERLEAWRSACRYLFEVLCKDGPGGKPLDCISVGDYGRIAALLGKAETLEEKA